MRVELVKRKEHSRKMALLSPLIAVGLTAIAAGLIFSISGHNPLFGLYKFFIEPLTQEWSLNATIAKATPLILIACGLSVCYLSNNWNIGAEGQFVVGALFGSALPILMPDFESAATLPLMMAFGAIGGALWALIPALLKTRFNTNEILTSLMLVYVASLLLDYLVRGPWRDQVVTTSRNRRSSPTPPPCRPFPERHSAMRPPSLCSSQSCLRWSSARPSRVSKSG